MALLCGLHILLKRTTYLEYAYIDGLEQDCSNPIA